MMSLPVFMYSIVGSECVSSMLTLNFTINMYLHLSSENEYFYIKDFTSKVMEEVRRCENED